MRTNSRNSKEPANYPVGSIKRSNSPFGQINQISTTNNKNSSGKKIISYSPYQKTIKEFESHGKSAKKKNQYANQKQFKQQRDKSKSNKFRIVTEPVDDRIMHLAQGNIFNSSLALRNPSTHNANSKKKIQTEIRQSQGIRLNLRQQNSYPSRSKQRIYSNTNIYPNIQISKSGQGTYLKRNHEEDLFDIAHDHKCPNCARYVEQLEYIGSQIKKIIKIKQEWKNGQGTFEDLEKIKKSKQSKSRQKNDKNGRPRILDPEFKYADSIIRQIQSNFSDLIKDIEVLSSIDYPKMLSMDIFQHESVIHQNPDSQQNQLKQLLSQLRSTVEGKIIDYDTYDTQSQNTYTKMIMRNMKSRLGNALRQNLELRIRKNILQKSEQISQQSQQYLRAVIEQVLQSYCRKIRK